jgi:hypothetical protein
MGKFLIFCFLWGVIATLIESFFLIILGRSMFAAAFFLILSTLGLVASYTPLGSELKGNRLELNWWQLFRSIPALLLIILISRHPNPISMNNPKLTVWITFFIGIWSSQLAVVIRSLLPTKR